MKKTETDYYRQQFAEKGFVPALGCKSYCEIGTAWQLSDKVGKGTYWLYEKKDLFNITIHDFFFHKDTILEFNWPECLSIMQYDSVSGEELTPYRRLEAGSIKSFIGRYRPYKVLIHKKIPIRSVEIEMKPAYYEDYLKEQYPDKYASLLGAFASVGQTMDFPEMSRLLRHVRDYRGKGMAANLFYEAKVAEALSLIVERDRALQKKQECRKKLSAEDTQLLRNLVLYLNDHCMQELPLEQITQVACMGVRKLQTVFKELYGCTITEYIQQRRMSQAENLLANTELSIGQVAQTVGYTNASRFAELFRKSTGLLPGEFRKMAQNMQLLSDNR